MLSILTVAGQDGADIAQAVAAAINGDPTLQGAGISADLDDNQVITNGTVTNIVINDPGIGHGEIVIPTLSQKGRLIAFGLLLGAALLVGIRRATR